MTAAAPSSAHGRCGASYDRAVNQSHDPLKPFVSAWVALSGQITATVGRTRVGPDGTLLKSSGTPVASLNAVISPEPDPDPEVIAALVEAEETWELPWSIHVRGVPSPRVTEFAARHGLTRFDRMPLMIRRVATGLPEAPAIDALRMRVVSPTEFDTYTAVLAEGFGAPHALMRTLILPSMTKIEGLTVYVAEVDGRPVGTGWTAISGELTGILNVSVLPAFRRRGYGRAITAELVRAGFATGAPTAYLYATAMGESVYASLGFRTEEHLTVITPGE